MSEWTLRDYQKEAVEGILQAFEEHRSTLLQAFTSAGKSLIMAEVIRRMQPCRAIVLAHVDQLIFQNAKTIQSHTGLDVQIEMADLFASDSADVIVGTWQTQVSGDLTKRMHQFDPMEFGLLIIDEADLAVASSYRKIIDHFQKNPNLKLCGLTATPKRHDREALGQVFESVAGRFDIHYGMEHGWLVDITQQFVNVSGLDFSHLKTIRGDFDQKELSRLLEQEPVIMGVCQPVLEVLHGLRPKTLSDFPVNEWNDYFLSIGVLPRKALLFTASVYQAELISNILNGAIPGLSEWICGKTPKDKRNGIFSRYRGGETRVLCNVGVATVGFDDHSTEVIFMGRPTKSERLYTQILGRGVRVLPGVVDGLEDAEQRKQAIRNSEKPIMRFIDFVGVSGKHRLISAFDILGGRISGKHRQKVVEQAILEGKPVRVARELTKAEIEEEKDKKKEIERQKQEQAERFKFYVGKSHFEFTDVNPLDALHIRRSTPWARNHHRKPTEGMARFLERRGINVEAQRITFSDAGKLIGKIKKMEMEGPPSRRQAAVLERHGIPVNGMTMKEASKRIDQIAKEEGWAKAGTE
jgi:superfamily II DNA or RNA helicase